MTAAKHGPVGPPPDPPPDPLADQLPDPATNPPVRRLGQQRLARERGIVRPHRRAVGADSAPHGIRLDRITVVLVETREAGNIGQTARAMLNMGLTRLTLVAPQCQPRAAEARQRAMHAWEVIKGAETVADLPTALAGSVYSVAFTTGTGRSEAAPVPFEAVLDTLIDLTERGDVALVFGNETNGLANADLRRCSVCTTLATSPALASLNLAQAVLIAAFQVFGHRRTAGPPDIGELATAAQQERLWTRLWETFYRTRALPIQNPRRYFARLRHSLSRQALTWTEVKIWLGVLGDVLKALDDPTTIKPTAPSESPAPDELSTAP